MESSDSAIQLEELETSLQNMYSAARQLVLKQNTAFITNLMQTATIEYQDEMKKLNSQVFTYLKPIELFLKHQKIKQKCLAAFQSIHEDNDELSKEFSELNENLDRMLESFDRDN